MLKIIQINTNRSNSAQNLLEATAVSMKIDLVLVSEPNIRKTRENPEWLKDNKLDTAIKVYNDNYFTGKCGKGKGFTWIETKIGRIYSCYVSPNIRLEEYEEFLDGLQESIMEIPGGNNGCGLQLQGNRMGGSSVVDARGRKLTEWLATNQLIVQNIGNQPTFQRKNSTSVTDITVSTENLSSKFITWKLLEEESLSDHNYIYFETITNSANSLRYNNTMEKIHGWKVNTLNKEKFKEEIDTKSEVENIDTARKLTEIVTRACNKSMVMKNTAKRNKREIYWWTTEIKEMRRDCIKKRRNYPRKQLAEEKSIVEVEYKTIRKGFRNLIKKQKDTKWRELCEDVERDVWGLSYKLVMKKLKPTQISLDMEERKRIVEELFPCHELNAWEEVDTNDFEPFTEEEITLAAKNIKMKKAPGPDGLPPEALKIVAGNTHQLSKE